MNYNTGGHSIFIDRDVLTGDKCSIKADALNMNLQKSDVFTVEKNDNECAVGMKSDSPYCMEPSILAKLKKIHNIQDMSNKTALGRMIEINNCNSESCLFKKNTVINVIGEREASIQLRTRFKPSGPYNSTKWFSNFNIDDVLEQYAKKYNKFLHIPFQMIDFTKQHTELESTDFVDIYNKGYKSFGVVLNSDTSYGSGKHWFCVYGDFTSTPITLEYFNSSGRCVYPELSQWMYKTKYKLEKKLNIDVKLVNVTSIQNQEDNHSCGTYSLYYLHKRLENVPYSQFTHNPIGDENMHNFRYNLFHKS